jgi:transcriptional regulator with XRE-family HTH domain
VTSAPVALLVASLRGVGELRFYRTRAGLSQQDLAARTTVSNDVISKIETGGARQAISDRTGAPQLWCILDEGVLHRAIGGSKVMRSQLYRLAEVAEHPDRLRGLVLLARLELVRVLQVVERASTAPGVQRTGEVAVSVAVAVWDEDPGYRGGEAGAAGTR